MEAYNKKGLDNMKVLAGKVLCVLTYEEDGQEVWTSGKVYRADQHKSGSWSIETNQGGIGLVPGNYLMDKFEDNFIDVSDKVILSDVVRYCYEQGVFKGGYKDDERGEGLYFDMEVNDFLMNSVTIRIEPDFKDYEDYLKPYKDRDGNVVFNEESFNDFLDELGKSRIAYMIAGVLDADKSKDFPYENERIYVCLREKAKDIEPLKNFMDEKIEEIRGLISEQNMEDERE